MMDSLHEILWSTTSENLRFLLGLLGVKTKVTLKSDLVAVVEQCYAGTGLNTIFASLGKYEKLAVAEACHAPDLLYDESRFEAKYGKSPEFFRKPKDSYSFCDKYSGKPGDATRLNLLLFQHHGTTFGVPADLAARLRQFVVKPEEASLKPLPEPVAEAGLIVCQTEQAALSDVMAMLRLAERGQLKTSEKTGMPSAAGVARILECLTGGDYFPPEIANPPVREEYDQVLGYIKPVAWSLLLQNARLLGSTSGKSKLSPAGVKALGLPPHEIIRDLWLKWLGNTTHDEFNRINDIKGQHSKGHMTAKPPRRQAIVSALRECPLNAWIDVEQFSTYMHAAGHDFSITNDRERLYLGELQYGNFGFNGYGGWNILQFRYILCLLFEYAATLGLIDIAYVHPKDGRTDYCEQWGADELLWLSRYDGLRAFKITPLGAYCLGLTEVYKATVPVSSLKFSVLPSLSIQLVAGQPTAAEVLLLETWAEPAGKNLWKLHAGRALAAVERGQSASDFAAFLQACDEQFLPESVEGFLKACESNGTALRRSGDALLFECRDGKTAELVCAQKELRNQCFRIGETGLAVPLAQETKFRNVARALGLGIV